MYISNFSGIFFYRKKLFISFCVLLCIFRICTEYIQQFVQMNCCRNVSSYSPLFQAPCSTCLLAPVPLYASISDLNDRQRSHCLNMTHLFTVQRKKYILINKMPGRPAVPRGIGIFASHSPAVPSPPLIRRASVFPFFDNATAALLFE